MLPFAYFLLKVIICSAVLFGYYWFFLRNKVFHAYNRFYLLAIIVLSVGLPLIKFNIFHEAANKTTVVKMLQVVTDGDEYMDEIIIGAPTKNHLSFVDFMPFLYAIISAVFLIMLVQMVVSIFYLLKKNEKINIENVCFINTDAARGTPFSFFKYIFWNKQIDINSPCGNRIFKHEIAHVQQRHSWDKMFINLVLILFWSNPVFWLIRKELSMIHEFIADKQAVQDGDTAAFAAMILQATYPQKNFYITNNFFYSPIKRRLMMLTRNQHPRMNYISRLLALPLLVIVFGAFTIKIAEKIDKGDASNKLSNKIIVVLDAGHGGQDAGVSKNGINEKDLALELVSTIKKLNSDKNIEIILLRETDVFLDVKQKAVLAKSLNPDLFISVHIDGTIKKLWDIKTGMSVWISNDEILNSKKSRVFASSVINTFQNNYGLPVSDRPLQRQQGIWTIKANDFPSILIEAGYLTNDKDAAYLLSEKGQEAFAKNVLDAISKYAAVNLSAINSNNDIQQLFDSSVYYKGKKVKSYEVAVDTKENKITGVKLLFYDNTTKKITLDVAQSIGIDLSKILRNTTINPLKISSLYLSDSIRRNNESVNLLMNVTKDSAEMVYLLNGKKISNAEGKEILSSSENDVQVYDAKAAFKSFGIQTKNGLINILNTSRITSDVLISNNNSVKVAEASVDDVKLFKKLGRVFIRVETDGELPYKGSNRPVFRDGKPQFSKNTKTYKGDIIIMLSSKEAIEKYGAAAFGGAAEITSKEQYEKVSGQKVNFNQTISDKVFTQVEVEPEFPGGKDAWRKFLQTNLNGSIATKEGLKAGNYTFITKFIVHEDGSLSDFTSEKNINDTIAKHCLEVIKKSAKWKPAIQNGYIVSAYRKQPITFVVAEE